MTTRTTAFASQFVKDAETCLNSLIAKVRQGELTADAACADIDKGNLEIEQMREELSDETVQKLAQLVLDMSRLAKTAIEVGVTTGKWSHVKLIRDGLGRNTSRVDPKAVN